MLTHKLPLIMFHNQSINLLNLSPNNFIPGMSFELDVKSQKGFSLVELMIALVIGLVVSLAIYGVLTANEGRKRTTTSLNDIDQGGTYSLYQIDKLIRSSGSGFSAGRTPLQGSDIRASDYAYGCPLRVANNGTQLIPAGSFPAPFSTVPGAIVMAPVVIVDSAAGTGGDVLITMAGSSGLGESGTMFSSTPSSNQLNLSNMAAMSSAVTVGSVSVADKLLITAAPSSTAMTPCLMSQISPGFVPQTGTGAVPLSGQFYSAAVAGTSLTSFPIGSTVLNLGKSPIFNMLGVGTNNTLFSYDLLNAANLNGTNSSASPNPSIFMDGVYRMEAVYGIASNPAATIDLTWVQPTGAFSAANLMAGTPAANANLERIVAIRVALVMTTSLPERTNVSASSITLFNSVGLPLNISLSPLNRRYRVVEGTVSLRNSMLP